MSSDEQSDKEVFAFSFLFLGAVSENIYAYSSVTRLRKNT